MDSDADRRAGARPRVAVELLSKSYSLHGQEMRAVADVSFTLAEGEFVTLLGPSGCGKSTILNMIAGLIPRSGGKIAIDGVPAEFGRTHAKVGYVFQRDALFPWRTVAANIRYGLEIARRPKAEIEARAKEALAQARLADFAGAFPLMLSGGMRQRASLMRTLVMRPEILLMDEPFGALDTHTKLDMHEILIEIWERERQTVLFVTHDLAEALTLADRIILLSARPGRIKREFRVDLPRPRDAVALRETRAFANAYTEIWNALGEEFRRGEAA